MKLNLIFPKKDLYNLNAFDSREPTFWFGDPNYNPSMNIEPSNSFLTGDYPLSEQLSTLIIRSKELLKAQPDIMGWYGDSNNHGSYGIVIPFVQKETCDNVKVPNPDGVRWPFVLDSLQVRISFGSPKNSELQTAGWDGSTHSRLHIGIKYMRQFLPLLDDEHRAVLGDGLPEDLILTEAHHFAMRWEEGEFDHKFERESNETPLQYPTRTSYSTVYQNRYSSLSPEETARLITLIPRRRAYLTDLLCSNLTTAPNIFTDQMRKDERFEYIYEDPVNQFGMGQIVETNYASLLLRLSQFGDVHENDASEIPQMNEKQGIDYFTKKIIPAMIAMRDSQRDS